MPDKQRPTPYNLEREMSKAAQLRAMLGEDADPQLVLDMIEGETEALECMDVLVEHVIKDENLAEGARKRAQRLEARGGRLRNTVLQMLERFGQRKVERPLYTVSVVAGRPSVQIVDDAACPIQFQRMSPDKNAIAAALKDGENVPGAHLNNAPPHLMIKP